MSKKAPAPSVGIPKVVWFEDSRGGLMRALDSETPTRYGKECSLYKSVTGMFPLHEAAPYEDIEIHEHSWVAGTRVSDPKEMVFEVRVTVKDHLTPKDALRRLQDVLQGRRSESNEGHDLISVVVKEPG